MDNLRKQLGEQFKNRRDDDSFVEQVAQLAKLSGDQVYQSTLSLLTSLDLPPTTSRRYWFEALEHQKLMTRALKRSVTLITAIADYIDKTHVLPFEPHLIDSNAFDKIVSETTKDSLTGLHNRSFFTEVFEQQISISKRYNTELSLLFLDIDNFKEINDIYGHPVGDIILKKIALAINSVKRESDIAVRYGGEEFVLLMPFTNNTNGMKVGERIRKVIAENTFAAENHRLSITVSGGLSTFPSNGATTHTLLKIADQALYQAKGAGKNIISHFKPDKRRYMRVKYRNPVIVRELGIDDNTCHYGIGKDICIGGLLFKNEHPFSLGSRIQVHTNVKEDTSLLLIGKVIRVESYEPDHYDIGVSLSFGEMEKIAREEISGLLKTPH